MTKRWITIYDLLPLLKSGWVAMDKDKRWFWYTNEPHCDTDLEVFGGIVSKNLSYLFNIAPL